jgi:hypothetical protein
MRLREWFQSGCDYRRRLLNSGLSGARAGGEEFLQGKRLLPILGDSARKAVGVAAAGACIGVLGGYLRNRQKSVTRALAFGMVGGAIGFGLGVASVNRGLGASVVSGAWKRIGRVRDERWLEQNPINYA